MFNDIAKLLAITGFILGVISWMILAATVGETRGTKAGAFFIVGCYVLLVDLAVRGLAHAGNSYWRFLSPACGGTVFFAPAWMAGLALLGGGILILEDDQ